MAGETPETGWRTWVMEHAATATGFQPAPIAETVAPMALPGAPHIGPSFDVIEMLPERAQDRLRKLRQRSDDLHAIIPPFADIQSASAERIAAENRLRQLQEHPQNHGANLPPHHPSVVQAQRLVNKLTDDFRRLQERSETRAAAWRAASQAKAACEDWLKIGKPSGVLLQDHEIEPPKLAKGENGLLDAIENRRRRVRELRADLHRIASAPFPAQHVKAQMRAAIEALAMQGPDVSMMVEHDGKLIWPMTAIRSEVRGADQRALAFAEVPDALALIAWLFKDMLIAALDREIATESDDGAALTHEQRQQGEAETMGDLLAIEFQESFFVWQAQSEGLPCEHRSDCAPQAILGVKLLVTPRADTLPETSPGFSWPWKR